MASGTCGDDLWIQISETSIEPCQNSEWLRDIRSYKGTSLPMCSIFQARCGNKRYIEQELQEIPKVGLFDDYYEREQMSKDSRVLKSTKCRCHIVRRSSRTFLGTCDRLSNKHWGRNIIETGNCKSICLIMWKYIFFNLTRAKCSKSSSFLSAGLAAKQDIYIWFKWPKYWLKE